MKKCNTCGKQTEDQASFCSSCGSTDLFEVNGAEPSVSPAEEPPQTEASADSAVASGETAYGGAALNEGNGNVLAGIVGAFLLSIIGGLLYFIVYQIGFIAGICGLIIFILANFGYGLFARTKNKTSPVALITAIVMTVLMIFAAEYACVSYQIWQAYKEYDVDIFSAVRATPEFLKEPEIARAVAGDLIFAYLFGFAATIGNIVNVVKAKKKKKK